MRRRTPHLNPLPFKKKRGRFGGSRKRALARCCWLAANHAGWARTKRQCRFRGTPLWEIQLELLRQLTPHEIFVSARSDPDWRPADIQFVADDPPSRGPLSGLAASLDRMSTSHLLALAIDMPWMTNKYLEFLCAQIEPGRGVVPKIGDRAEPLAAIYPREAAIDFHHALTGTDFSLQTLVRHLLAAGRLREVSIAEQERKLFRNVNEPVDLQSV